MAKGVKITGKKSVVTEDEAKALFKEFKNNKDIPFDFPVDCCPSRAHAMCTAMKKKGIESKKYFLYDEEFPYNNRLAPMKSSGEPVEFPNEQGEMSPVKWKYHVAPLVKVQQSDGTVVDTIIDPSITNGPVSKKEWEKIQGNTKTFSRETDSDVYFLDPRNGYTMKDEDGTESKERMEKHKTVRDESLIANERKSNAKMMEQAEKARDEKKITDKEFNKCREEYDKKNKELDQRESRLRERE
jgi:hypothetical protein